MNKFKSIDEFFRKNNHYGYYVDRKFDFNEKFGRKFLNCSDRNIKYNDIDDVAKRSFVFSCMGVVCENWNNRVELIDFLNELYDFDLVKEYNFFIGWKNR